jgi:hypothetical protein
LRPKIAIVNYIGYCIINGAAQQILESIGISCFMEYKQYPDRFVRHWISGPFLYGMFVPIVFLDLCIEIYHRICFPLYGIPLVNRSEYVKFDRAKLAYLSAFDKLSCTYCSYANGIFAYAVAIAGKTEAYWCGIKHAKYEASNIPAHQAQFIEYGDKLSYQELQPKTCGLARDRRFSAGAACASAVLSYATYRYLSQAGLCVSGSIRCFDAWLGITRSAVIQTALTYGAWVLLFLAFYGFCSKAFAKIETAKHGGFKWPRFPGFAG